MIDVAVVTDCEKLYRLSGWNGQYWWWQFQTQSDGSEGYMLAGEHEAPFTTSTYPAYDAGYLLQHLPAVRLEKDGSGAYDVMWMHYDSDEIFHGESRTSPAHALCRLAIVLFENGVLLHAKA